MATHALLMKSGGGGDGSDECTAIANQVIKGQLYIGSDTDDEVGTGTLELTGNARNIDVLVGRTFYSNNPHSKQTGTMPNKSGTNTAFSTLNDVSGNMGNIKSLTDSSSSGDTAISITCAIPKGYYDDNSNATLRVWGINRANVRAGQPIGYVNNTLKGTFTADANANASQILSGRTAYVNGQKITGTMAVQSILSFNVAVYSSTAITFTWTNPAKGAFSGIIIVGKTGAYPNNIKDGTRYYKGYGSNVATQGKNSTTINSFKSGVTYYFRAFSYATVNNGELVHEKSHTASAKTTKGLIALTSSGTWTVPAGVRSIDVFCVGGGEGGEYGGNFRKGYTIELYSGFGGSSGCTVTRKNIDVTPGAVFPYLIGAGGAGEMRGNNIIPCSGGNTSFSSLVIAKGGKYNSSGSRVSGGSGGGGCVYKKTASGGNGGSDGGNGADGDSQYNKGLPGRKGQGTTTRAFGESGNTLYAGGGGGGGGNAEAIFTDYANGNEKYCPEGGSGGSGGGGNGGGWNNYAVSGAANTGGGGGGGSSWYKISEAPLPRIFGAAGGSGVILIRWGY